MNDMDKYIKEFKNKRKKSHLSKFISKVLLSTIIILICLIYASRSDNNKNLIKDYFFSNTLKFTKIKSYYEKLFGDVLPKDIDNSQMVFNEGLVYKSIDNYYDGEKLLLNSNTPISNITSGIVVFIGQKDNYGNTVVIQGIDGADIWYGNINNVSVKLYDYVEKNTIIGETIDDKLYLVIKKDNDYIKYEDYQSQ